MHTCRNRTNAQDGIGRRPVTCVRRHTERPKCRKAACVAAHARVAAASRARRIYSKYCRPVRRQTRKDPLLPHQPDRQRLVDTIPAQVWIAAPDGSITYVNRQRLEYTGLTAEQALDWGWTTGDVFHPEDLPGLIDAWQRMVAAGQPGEAEARVRRFDGTYRWFLIRAVPYRDVSAARPRLPLVRSASVVSSAVR